MKRPARPYLVMGPDIHGPTVYGRFKALRNARRFLREMEKHWTILRVVHAGRDLMSECPRRSKRFPNGDQEY